MSTLSIVIITKNEQELLPGALESSSFADELIVVDAESGDDTVKIAKRAKAKVYSRAWDGFATQRNFSLSKATGDWIFVLDADERISDELRTQILGVTKSTKNPIMAYDVGRRNFFYGKEMKHGGWNTERMVRLFKRGSATYASQQIHEYLQVDGEVGHLAGSLYHFTHRDIALNLLKTRQYAIIQSEIEVERNHVPVTRKSLFSAILEHFWLRYVKLEAYKDGMEGFIESVYQAFSQIFVIQSMIWERQRGKSVQEIYRELDKQIKSGSL